MPSANAFQTNMTAGEISPRLYARVDVAKYMNGAQKLENFIVQRFGGIRKRGGLQYINEVKDSTKPVRLIPFVPVVGQSYILELGDEYIRFYTNGGVVTSGGNPVEVVTPWDETEVWDLQFVQSVDVLYITHPDYAPRSLSRLSATSFQLDKLEFTDGPYLELNDSSTTLTPASYGALTPLMTSNTAPSGTVDSTGSSASAFQVFDKDLSVHLALAGTTAGFVSYELASGTKVVDAYYVVAGDSGNLANTPINWVVEGSNDGSTWVVLDSQSSQSGWYGGERRYFEFLNKTAYSHHRFRWLGVDGGGSTRIAEIGFNEAASSQTAFNLTASSTTGINDDNGFQSTDVGRPIRILGSDGKWRWFEITGYTSSTVVSGVLHGHALPDLSPIANWQMGAWSDYSGWPKAIGFYTGRLGFANTEKQPQTVWLSKVDDFTNFGVSEPLVDDDAITVTVTAESLSEINWIAESTDLFLGTSPSIRTLGPTSQAAAFSPTNVRQKRETNFGAADVLPVRVGTTALYTGYYRNDIREITYSFDVNGYVSQDLSILAEHIPALGVKQIAFAQSPDSVVWFVLDDGTLAGMTYERDQEVVAFHRHPIAGTSATVESVASIPGSGGDEVWVSVKRTIDGGTVRYLERLSEGLSDTSAKEAATFLDSYLAYSGSSTTTLSGLDHLEGESVYVWSGSKQGPYTVSSGSITIGTAVTSAIVGLAYTSVMETLSPEAAAAGGTAQTRLGHISDVFVRLNRSMNGKIGPVTGTIETLDYTKSTDTSGNYGTGTDLFTGDVRVPISMKWERGKRLRLEHGEPSPFHCLGFVTETRVSG